MAFLSYLDISVSGMAAQRLRSEVIQHNVANANTVSTSEDEPYRRQMVVLGENRPFKHMRLGERPVSHRSFGSMLEMTLAERRERKLAGVQVLRIVEDQTPFTPVFDPTHPDADEEGYYYRPNVDVAEEMMDLMATTRAYEVNVTIFDELKNMSSKALTIGR